MPLHVLDLAYRSRNGELNITIPLPLPSFIWQEYKKLRPQRLSSLEAKRARTFVRKFSKTIATQVFDLFHAAFFPLCPLAGHPSFSFLTSFGFSLPPWKVLCSVERGPQHRAWRGAIWGWTSLQSSVVLDPEVPQSRFGLRFLFWSGEFLENAL